MEMTENERRIWDKAYKAGMNNALATFELHTDRKTAIKFITEDIEQIEVD